MKRLIQVGMAGLLLLLASCDSTNVARSKPPGPDLADVQRTRIQISEWNLEFELPRGRRGPSYFPSSQVDMERFEPSIFGPRGRSPEMLEKIRAKTHRMLLYSTSYDYARNVNDWVGGPKRGDMSADVTIWRLRPELDVDLLESHDLREVFRQKALLDMTDSDSYDMEQAKQAMIESNYLFSIVEVDGRNWVLQKFHYRETDLYVSIYYLPLRERMFLSVGFSAMGGGDAQIAFQIQKFIEQTIASIGLTRDEVANGEVVSRDEGGE